jgi:hypothetical protein
MKNHYLIGKRIKIEEMVDEPFPVEPNTMGTITNVGYDIINVKWDNGRSLGVVIGEDRYEIMED